MTHFDNNLKDFEYLLAQVDDWIIDLKDQRAELDDIEHMTKELYEVMYEFETIRNSVEKVVEYVNKSQRGEAMKMLEVLFDENDLDGFIEAIHFAEDEFKEHLEVMSASKMCEDEREIFDIYANALTYLENLRDNLYMTKEVDV